MEIKEKLRPKPPPRKKAQKEEPEKVCHVVFWNGVHFSPAIVTSNRRIEERLRDCLNDYAKGMQPGYTASQFVAISVAEGFQVGLFSLPEKSVGGTVAFIQRPEFWPREGRELAGGVFLVSVEDGMTSYWGGDGLDPEEGFNPGIPRNVCLKNVEIIDDGNGSS